MPEGKAAPALPRKAPHGSFWDQGRIGFRCQITLLNGKRYRAFLRMPDGTKVTNVADVHGAMVRLCIKLVKEERVDPKNGIVVRYLPARGENIVTLPSREPVDDDEQIEIPSAMHDEIASFTRTMWRATPENARDLLRRLAPELYRVLGVVKTEQPAQYAIACQATVDALHEVADHHGIDHDDAQLIFAEAKKDAAERASDSGPNEAEGTAKTQATENGSLITCRASEVTPERIEWIWPGRIARGKHTAIAGDPGAGKSQVMISIAAAVTNGEEFPCGEGRAQVAGNVVILAAEDGVGDTIVPRLHAAGADLGRVHIVKGVLDKNITRMFNLQDDLQKLREKVAELGDVQLIGIDPVSSYLGRGVDSHKNAELRAVLEPVGRLAEETRAAVLSVTHFSKAASSGASTKALYRFIGSLAFVAAPRIAFAVIEDQDDRSRRLFLHVKNNLARPPQGLAFRLEQSIVDGGIVASRVAWDSQPVSMTADQAIGAEGDGEPTAKDDAISFLREALAGGAVAVPELEQSARDAGYLGPGQSISQSKPFRCARELLAIRPFQQKGKKSGGWFWALPVHRVPSDASDAPIKGRASDGAEGI